MKTDPSRGQAHLRRALCLALALCGCEQSIVIGRVTDGGGAVGDVPDGALIPVAELRFSLGVTYAAQVELVAAGDLNRDGWPDVVSVSAAGGVRPWLGRGGALTEGTPQAAGPRPVGLQLGDVDGDGVVDAVVVDQDEARVLMYPGDGRGGFAGVRAAAAGPRPGALALADLDRDGLLDILVAGSGVTTVLPGQRGAGPGPARTYPGCGEGAVIHAADLTGGGIADVVVGCRDGGVVVLRGTGDGSLRADQPMRLPWAEPAAALLLDLVGDARPDLALTGPRAGLVQILPNQGGQLQLIDKFATTLPVGEGPVALLAADLDGDGQQDLATAGAVVQSLSVLPGAAVRRGQTGATRHFATAGIPRALCAADLDRDGRIDLISAWQGGGLAVLRNTSPPR